MTINFDYSIFYSYYTDPLNISLDLSVKPDLNYFPNYFDPIQFSIPKPCPNEYITIKNIRIFISTGNNNRLYFTIPTFNANKFWDDHYHFGLRKNFIDYKSQPKRTYNVVFFHKTIQNPLTNGKELPTNCYFEDNISLANIDKIVCQQASSTNTMESKFPQEIDIIREIISRPFFGIQYGGKIPSTIKIIYLDNNSKPFIIKNKKRLYIKTA